MNFQRPRNLRTRPLGSLPMTSMIDVVFLLLVFFMVTASISAKEAELGSALKASRDGSGQAADLQPQVVRVERSGRGGAYTIGNRVVSTQEALTGVLSQLPKEAGVFVRVADNAPVRASAAALQACKDAGFERITYVPAE